MREKRTGRAAPLMMASAVMLMLVACEPTNLIVSAANAQVPSPAPTPPPARNPAIEAAVATVNKIMADPSKKEALCAYARAREGVGAAMSAPAAGPTSRNPILRERQREAQQVDQFRALGSAQGAERQAAGAVDPEFAQAVGILRVGNFMEAIRVDLALRALCTPQQ
jgi:hypothetical protein